MRVGLAACAAASMLMMAASRPSAQEPQAPGGADFNLQVYAFFDAAALEEFTQRVQRYVELRGNAERGLPARRVTRNPAELEEAERRLAERIQTARAAAAQGDVFIPPIESGIKRLLVLEVDRATLASITADNPGEFGFEVNSSYPKGIPLSSVPPNILAMLPTLAEDLEYRFVGRHLILRDARANVVIDHIPYAVECTDCADLIEGEADGDEEVE